MSHTEFSEEKIEKLKNANKRLMIDDDSNEERQRNLIFIYCPPKVGSTSLVSSIRLFANEKYNVIHFHSDIVLSALYNIDVSINDIINYNSYLGKKIYVFDIYRTPIEHKISIFFEKLEKFHFNASFETIEKFEICNIIKRFNNLFPYLGENDYYRNEYCINAPEVFDFEKKYSLVEDKNIKYIKLRLFDSIEYWPQILKEILNIDVRILRDYETKEKSIKGIYNKFIESYNQLPCTIETRKKRADLLEKNGFREEERTRYLSKWQDKTSNATDFYSIDEYTFYLKVSTENQYMSEVQEDHYIDNGCTCENCFQKRKISREDFKLRNRAPTRIVHEAFRPLKTLYPTKLKKKFSFRNINFNMMKGT
jgi:hypothetical protein